MVVQHNLSAMNANRYLGINNSKLSKSLEKLSSGYAINRAGDNAAGLAVSEKMRSQIAGMTQAVKNAQDGISMVQTFEGALTETDSILQRMKTLADQMANGTYDDPVDRTAAQQEFLQLNDELDQIADTDFNGVIVLNGGVMSDGLKAVDGEFNYRDAAKAAATTDAAVDIFAEEGANVLDNSGYNKDVADAIWEKLGLDPNKVKDIEVTFTYDGENWNGTAVVDKATGKIIDKADASQIKTSQDAGKGSGEGGFVIETDKGNMAAVFNEEVLDVTGNKRKIAEGDTVTFHFQNNADRTYAPKNGALAEGTLDVQDNSTDPTISKLTKENTGVSFELAEIKDSDMTADVATDLDNLKAAKFKITYANGAGTLTNDKGLTVGADGTITGASGVALGKVTFTKDIQGTTPAKDAAIENLTNTDLAASGVTASGADADKVAAALENANANSSKTDASLTITHTGGTWTCAALGLNGGDDAALAAATGITITGTMLATDTISFDYKAPVAQQTGTDTNIQGTVEFKVDVDSYNVKANADLVAETVATSQAAKDAAAGGFEVSKSNAFKNSEAIMTYKESIILQAGARTKDAVEFTFKYDSKAIGDLKADLNCTAKGLGTDKLNLSSQKAANYAIDKIDQAINKVSLVRGTFGAIQNRLEHKIDNLNVSVENLTSAESQIRDTNMPQEMMNFTKQQILAQASQSMLAQANQLPQGVLSLLQ